MTNILNHNWYSAYANEFPFAADDLDVDKLKNITKEAIVFYEWAQLWLEGFLGFESKLVISKVKTRCKFQALR